MKINPHAKLSNFKNCTKRSINYGVGVNPKIFKAYDIRGVYPKEINQNAAYLIGRAFVDFLGKKKLKVVVGRDARLSSPLLYSALTRGIIEGGANVVDIGLSTTPMLYFAVANFKFDGGINITASHNSFQYNGFKLVREKAIPISEISGIKKIKELAIKGNFKKKDEGNLFKKEILRDYVNFNLRNFNFKKREKIKLVIDTANSVSGIVIPEIFKKINFKIHHLFSKLDGNFPNHPPNPLLKENLKNLCREVKNKKADLGVAFDGDGDRIVFVDEKGEIVEGGLITALMSSLVLKGSFGKKILYDVRSSNIIKETIKKKRGVPIPGRIGHSFIKEKMRRENIIFAGELSGHYYSKNHYFCEAPFFVLFKIIKEILEKNKPFSEIVSPYKKYYHSGEINLKIKNKNKALKALEKKFEKGKKTKIDGIRIDFQEWWFLARPSNTEPLLRLVIEAKTKELMEKKKKEIVKTIK